MIRIGVVALTVCILNSTVMASTFGSSQSSVLTTFDVTWASKYMTDGFEIGESQPVLQLAAKADLYDSGVSVMLWSALQMNRKLHYYDEQDFFLMYSKDFLKESPYAINLHGYYDYWIFPNSDKARDELGDPIYNENRHGNKFQVGISAPRLWSFQDSYIVPSINVYHWLYWKDNRKDMDQSGTRHELLLEYYRAIKIFLPKATYQYAGATTSLNYHSGAFEVKPGISHSTLSLVSGVYAFKSIFALSLNQQWTYEKSVHPSNEFWSTLSYIKKF